MRTFVHRARRAGSLLGLAGLVGLAMVSQVVTTAAPAEAVDREVTVVNQATGRACARSSQASCANGSYLVFTISPAPTVFRGTLAYPNFRQQIFDNAAQPFTIRNAQCPGVNLAISAVAAAGTNPNTGQPQVKVTAYQPGNVGYERFGSCPGIADPDNGRFQDVTWQVNGASGSPFGLTLYELPGRLWHTSPSIMPDGETAQGVHLVPGTWSGSGLDIVTPLSTCYATPSRCPSSTNGQRNYVILIGNGLEDDGCPRFCDRTWAFRLDTTTEQRFFTTESIGPGGLAGNRGFGADQLYLRIPEDVGAGVTYSLGQTNQHIGLYQFLRQSSVKFRFGAPN